MKVLGLSTATKIISFGLIDEDKVLLETTVAGMNAEKVLFYAKEAGLEPKQIEGIAVAQGPGSYSGLRGGLATAKTLAQTLKVPLVGVSTLAAIAYNLVDSEGTLAVKLDAKRDEYNFALFAANNGQLKRLTDDLVITDKKIEEFLAKVTGNLKLVDGQKYHPYGVNVAKLGLLKLKAGQKADPLKMKPEYSHQPNIIAFEHRK